MIVKALRISVGMRPVGVLFQYALSHDQVINRFVADDAFARAPKQPMVSLSYQAANPQAQAAFWAGVTAPQLNGSLSADPKRGWLLPAFFQNLLPEGPLRERIAALRRCDVNDHFEILAATGNDLPGDVHAVPADLDRNQLSRLITHDNDALEMSVVAQPINGAISVSGVQAKLGVLKHGDHFVARTKITDPAELSQVRHVIAKLPVGQYPDLPQVEDLSLRMASAAGVAVVEAELAPLGLLKAEHDYDLGDVDENSKFLAVYRYDRDVDTPTRRVHCEDFAQILGVQPEAKYSEDYLTIAGVMLDVPTLGEPAVHELLRRILVSEMLGNPDMHLKNVGLRYADGRTPDLPPAYDIVAYKAYGVVHGGRALRLVPPAEPGSPGYTAAADPLARLSPIVVRDFCSRLGLPEKPARTALRRCAEAALDTWPAMISATDISDKMKERLLEHLDTFRPRARR